jgi:hypothetical protein
MAGVFGPTAQAIVLLVAALVTLAMMRRTAPEARRLISVLRVVAFTLALGVLRALIWAAGQPVYLANLVVFLIAVIAIAWAWRVRRRRPRTAA